ncbi:hypothetical protein V6N12_035862 [Hibiscus sabdariffa]|uniref:Uncharacterized protein n=1 Tax=Hibiscus sabdariffa TaxID=183260 RepID=A0ABR2EPC1_9ROSI
MAGLVSSDTSACGGVLIVNGGVFRALFAGPVAHLSLAMATLRVVLVALSIFLETRLAENFGLEVEIGSVQDVVLSVLWLLQTFVPLAFDGSNAAKNKEGGVFIVHGQNIM